MKHGAEKPTLSLTAQNRDWSGGMPRTAQHAGTGPTIPYRNRYSYQPMRHGPLFRSYLSSSSSAVNKQEVRSARGRGDDSDAETPEHDGLTDDEIEEYDDAEGTPPLTLINVWIS